ncbi:MAG: sigma-54-dependent Fis family transcriptional regulator [Candidatus Riflebacteria bacterium]|nr:sigma-54-dependent Fis family transcriptional regulator [Candidatus Riflebacteria bacterium]
MTSGSGGAADNALLKALLHTGEALSSTLELDTLLDLVMDSACRILSAGAASLLLIDQETKTLYFKTASGEKREELKNIRLKLGEGIAGWVAKEGRPLLVGDVWKEPKFKREISQNIQYSTQSIVCVPLLLRGKTVGVMEVLNKLGGKQFTGEDLEALCLLARHVANALDNARRYAEAHTASEGFRELLHERYTPIGSSPLFKEIMHTVAKVATTRSTVLLRGESGTGKEVVARAIHQQSRRASRALVAVNCAALSENLLESELYGHEKGAFTGADRLKRGKFELADGGTIFLDEIGCMSPHLQTKLLRVLQDRQVDRLGSEKPTPIDVRVIAATNADLEASIRDGRFREDLFYRLNVITITLPPLRARREDIPVLAEFFIDRYNRETNRAVKGLTASALDSLLTYDFPGNIRELENLIERAVVLEEEDYIQPERFPFGQRLLPQASPGGGPSTQAPILTLEELERRYILDVLERCGWKKSRACSLLGISRPTLDRKLAAYGVQRPEAAKS